MNDTDMDQKQSKADILFQKSVMYVLITISGLFLLAGIGVFLFQILLWLINGTWSQIPTVIVFYFFDVDLMEIVSNFNWIGLRKIALWLLDIPLGLTLFFTGIAGIMSSMYFEGQLD